MVSLNTLNHPFSKLTLVYLFWIAAGILGGALFEVYFFGLGMGMPEIFSTAVLWFTGSLILTPLFKRINLRRFMLVGIAIGLLSVAVLYAIKVREAAFAFRFLLGLTHFFFWIPFNIAFYGFGKENNARLSALYYSVGPLLMLLLPGFSGLVASTLGYESVYALAIISYIITFILALSFLENRTYEYDFLQSIRSVAGLRTLVFLEGMAPNIMVSVILEIMLLKYASGPLEFGAFTSLTTIFAIIASIMIAHLSDRQKRRREFIIMSSAGFGAAAVIASSAPDIAAFFIGVSLINFVKTIFFPMPMALVIDNSRDLPNTMVGREFVLNSGRVAGAVLGTVLTFYYDVSFALFAGGIIMLFAYPFAFEIKKRKLFSI